MKPKYNIDGDVANITYLKPGNVVFKQSEGCFLSLTLENGEFYPKVDLIRAYPFTKPREYISVRSPEGKEIGIIRELDAFPAKVVRILEQELERRYFTPNILKIYSIKEEFGYYYWHVDTEAGTRKFITKRDDQNIRLLKNNGVLITDVDGNRFVIEDYNKLDALSYKLIELIL